MKYSSGLIVLLLALVAQAKDEDIYYIEDYCGQQLQTFLLPPLKNAQVARLRLSRDHYAAPPTCRADIVFRTSEGFKVMVTTEKFKLGDAESSGLCLRHFLQVEGFVSQHNRICQEMESAKPGDLHLTTSWDLSIIYSRIIPLEKVYDLEFTMTPVAYANMSHCPRLPHNETGEEYPMFQCNDSLCIPKQMHCDKITNCQDGSDELDCQPDGTIPPPTVPIDNHEFAIRNDPGAGNDDDNSSGHVLYIVLGVVGGVLLIALIVLSVVFGVMRSRRHKFNPVATTENLEHGTNEDEVFPPGVPRPYHAEPINTALAESEDGDK